MRANKALGQHFLKDQTVISAICSDYKNKAKSILEIGPGPGVLTKNLSELELPFYAIEKDSRFAEILTPLVDLTISDALKVDLQGFIEERSLEDLWLVSNLPYNVASPLLINFLQTPSLKYMTLMFQKEVGEKIIAEEMSSLYFLCNNYYTCRLLKRVPPGAFNPPPKVDSIVISFEQKESPQVPLSEFENLERVVRQLFSAKRKQLGTVLKHFHPADKVKSLLNKCEIDTKIRAQVLTSEMILALYQEMKSWP